MIVCHLQRNHDIKISRNGCYQVLLRNKLNRLPENITRIIETAAVQQKV